MTMGTVCIGGIDKDITYTIYEDEDGEYIATVKNHKELKTETFHKPAPAKKWINRMLDKCNSEQNEIDRFN